MNRRHVTAALLAIACALGVAWILWRAPSPTPTGLVAAPPPAPAVLPSPSATPGATQVPPLSQQAAMATPIAALNTRIAQAQATASASPPASVGHLLNVATGEVHRLWGERETGQGLFAGGGRWLAYAAGPFTQTQRVFVADLSVWPPALQDFGPGIQPLLSPSGAFLVYSTGWYGDTASRVVVKDTATGSSVATFDGRGFNWSPDGRWLTFQGPWAGEGVPIRMYLTDTASWAPRLAYQMLPCSCDSTFGPYWSPDNRWFAYGRIVEGDAYVVDALTLDGPRLPATPTGWAGPTVVKVGSGAQALHYDMATGVVTTDVTAARPGGFGSPHGSLVVRKRGTLTFTNPLPIEVEAVRPDGSVAWTALGSAVGWSSDGEFFALSRGSGPTAAVEALRRADGSIAQSYPGARGVDWSPVGSTLLYTVSQGRQGCVGPIGNRSVLLHFADVAAGTDRALAPAFELRCREFGPQVIWTPDVRFALLCNACKGF